MSRPATLTLSLLGCWLLTACEPAAPPAIEVGVLHSLTGTMAVSESPLVDSALLAIDDINRAGGVLGRPLKAVVVDGESNPQRFAREAQRLITEKRVPAIFGCWTSACRKAIKPVIEHYQHLWFYPLQYEGMEQSSNIVYTGAAPNQQVIPGMQWALQNLGKRVYLIGSDYVFPRTANRIVRDVVSLSGGEVLAERYLPLGASGFTEIVADIARLDPDVVINTVNGDSNIALFAQLRGNPATATTPVLSFSVAEAELIAIGRPGITAHYAAWNYFQSLDNPLNRAFVERFKARFGRDRVTDDPMEATYVGLRLWAAAANESGSLDPDTVLRALARQSISAPGGIISFDRDTQHLWKTARIGQARPDGQFDVLWSSEHPIRPQPFPDYRYREEWTTPWDGDGREPPFNPTADQSRTNQSRTNQGTGP